MIQIGNIYHFWCNFTNPQKEKFLICVGNQPVEFFIINSAIHPFIAGKPPLAVQQVLLPANDHAFLTHDSWINCSETVSVTDASDQLLADAMCDKGPASRDVCESLITVVGASATLADIRITRIVANLGTLLAA